MATNNVYSDQELLRGLFELLALNNGTNEPGLTEESVFLILTKKRKDADKKQHLTEAFKFVKGDELDTMNSAKFYDLLQYNGYRYMDEQADVVLKEADPKAKKEFDYNKFIDNIIKVEKKKKKKKGKKKK